MFIDKAKINVKAGNGGNGAVAWRREKYEPSGGPAGGDGGNGGSVILKVDEGLRTLMDFKYKRHYKAEPGENGKNKKQYGRNGKDLILRVPPGTVIRDVETDLLIADLKENGEEVVVARGGRGGKGNAKFANSIRQAPRFAESGGHGEEVDIILELKLLADVGLIGFPNVGKSTLLSVITDAKPKIANYHFTTLSPNLGVVQVEDGDSFVIADIPGIIEGASEGIGLGHEFLRHIERTRILVHLIDISSQEGRDPIEDFHKINQELKKYSEKLSEKPQLVVANKIDIPGYEENLERLEEEVKKYGYDIVSISAVTKEGIKELEYKILEMVNTYEREELYEDISPELVYQKREKSNEVIVRKEGEIYIVEGYPIEKLVDSTNFDDIDSLRHFQEVLRVKGIIDQLRELGVDEEDIVNICGYEFEFFE
ncbi:MAG: GTPase ObgE [Andreesenia angusta]|nr:GTPase ObgE [Andreesenia angusta]